jgi:RNA polymerase sigma-70 factor, ECF subfamily
MSNRTNLYALGQADDAGDAPSKPAAGDTSPTQLGVASTPFKSVYEEHLDFVWRTLRLLGVAPEAREDATQEVFSIAARKLPSFDGRSAIGTWLFAIAQRVAANQRRTRRRKVEPLEPLGPSLESQQPTAHAFAEAAEAAERIERFCAGLDEGPRAVFVLALVEEVPAPEIAKALNIPVNTVYSRVRTLRQDLKRWLDNEEAERG